MSSPITQNKILNSLGNIPIEVFKWGQSSDHFKIDMPHKHTFDELLFFECGGGIHEINFHEYEIKPNAIHFVPKGEVHFLKNSQPLKGFTIAFESTFLDSNEYHAFSQNVFFDHYILNFSAQIFGSFLEQIKLLEKYIKSEYHFAQKKCYLMTLDLLFNNLVHEVKIARPKLDMFNKDSIVKGFENLLKTHIKNQNKIKWYAKCLSISPKILCDRVRDTTGVGAKQLLINTLIISVKKELLNTPKSIKEISLDHGYDPSSLGKIFKKQVGYTMKQYGSAESI